jgi:archaellum component FlaG (FlaF/FlaG flagellin family)
MAGADVIEAAMGFFLLVIVSYVVFGTIMTSVDTVSNAQNDMTLSHEERLGTSINITNYHYQSSGFGEWYIHFRVLNNGNQMIHDINEMDVMLIQGSNAPLLYTYGSGTLPTTTWINNGLERDSARNPEVINPNQWDPGEYLYGQIEVNVLPTTNDRLEVVLSNGVEAITNSNIYSE